MDLNINISDTKIITLNKFYKILYKILIFKFFLYIIIIRYFIDVKGFDLLYFGSYLFYFGSNFFIKIF
jgi:hypothetical protein